MLDMARLLKQIPSALAVLALMLGVFSPLGAFSVFQTGYWNLVDSSFIAVLLSGILATGALLLRGLIDGKWKPEFPLSAVFLLVLTGLGGGAAVNAAVPMVALIGTYQSAYGPVWHLLAAILIVALCDLKRQTWALQAIGLAATATALIVSAVLAYTMVTGQTIFIPGGDSYGLIGFLMLFFPDENRGKGKSATVQFYGLRASAMLLIVLSQNLTLIVLLGLGGILAGTIWAVKHRRPKLAAPLQCIPQWGVVVLVIVLAAAPLGLIMSGAADEGGMSLRMRSILSTIMSASIQDSSWSEWLFGHGWGHTQMAFFQYLHWGNMVLYTNEWDFLWRDIFHSHNFVIETLYSVGAAGLVCLVAFIASIYLGAPEPRRITALAFVIGYVLYSSVWFELSFHLPYIALALASFTSPRIPSVDKRAGNRSRAVPTIAGQRWWVIGLSICIIGLLSLLTVSYAQFSTRVYPLKADKGSIENERFLAKFFPNDPRQSEFVRSMLYRDALRYVERHKELHNPQGLAVLKDVLQDVSQRIGVSRSPELVLIGLDMFNDISFLPEWAWAASVIDGKQVQWKNLAERSLDLSPYRSDVLIPYLAHLLIGKQFEALEMNVKRILSKKSDDPVAMYFLGAMHSQAEDIGVKRAGLSLIANALDCGIDRFMEIPEWLVNSVQAYRRPQAGCRQYDGIR